MELLATGESLLLAPPMANEKMSMYCLYANSLIGSHAGNPTLLAISEEMRARYLAEPDFYDRKPSLAEDPAGFYRYAERLSYLTGPALLTEVVDQRLPALRTLRQVMHLHGMPVDSDTFIDSTPTGRHFARCCRSIELPGSAATNPGRGTEARGDPSFAAVQLAHQLRLGLGQATGAGQLIDAGPMPTSLAAWVNVTLLGSRCSSCWSLSGNGASTARNSWIASPMRTVPFW